MEISEQVSNITKGKSSLTEALSQLEVVKQAFKRSDEVKELLGKNQIEMNEIKTTMNQMVSLSYFNGRIEDLIVQFEKHIHKKFDEFSSTYFSQLQAKISVENIETYLSKKVNWPAFNNLAQQVSSIQSRFDKHLYSEYEGFKTKMKLELASKANDSKNIDINNEEFSGLKSRIVSIEQKLEEMFMEEDVMQDDEDYDSQEEMDNMLDDIDRVAKRESSGSDEAEGEDAPHSSSEVFPEPSQHKSEVSLGSEMTSIENIITPEPDPKKTISTESEAKKIDEPKKNYPEFETKKSIPNNTSEGMTNKLEIEKPTSRNSRARGSSIGGESRLNQRRESKESSIAASRVLAGGAGMKQINRKIIAMQKDIENNKVEIEEKNKNILEVREEIQKSYNYIENLENQVKNMTKTLDVMENSFIRALRRNGLDKNKKTKEKIVNLPIKQIESVEKNIEDKLKRIINLEIEFEKVEVEFFQNKKIYKEKFNEIISTLKYFEEFKQKVQKDLESVTVMVNSNFNFCKSNFSIFSSKIAEMNQPLTDLISDQQRENKILSEDLRRNQELFRALVEEYALTNIKNPGSGEEEAFIGYTNRVAENYFKKNNRTNSATPDLSVKNKFYKTNQSNWNAPPKLDSNWLGALPDGKAISLPRVAAKTNR